MKFSVTTVPIIIFLPIRSGDYITWSINFNDDLSSTGSFRSTIDASDFVVVGDGGPLRNVELTVTQDPDAYSYYPTRCENPQNCWDVRAKIDTSHNNFQDNRFQYGNLYELRLSGTSDITNRFGDPITTLTPSSPTSTNELRVRVDSEAPRLNAFDTYDQSTNRAYTGAISSLRPSLAVCIQRAGSILHWRIRHHRRQHNFRAGCPT